MARQRVSVLTALTALVVLFATSTASDIQCSFEDNNICYVLKQYARTFRDAHAICVGLGEGGHLARVTRTTVVDKLRQYITAKGISTSKAIWIGLYQKSDGYWYNGDKTRFNFDAFRDRWDNNEPNNQHTSAAESADCAITLPSSAYRWRDRSCYAEYSYLCQVPTSSGETVSTTETSFCPSGGVINPTNGRCYKWNSEALSWVAATQACNQNGGTLAIFENKDTIIFIRSIAKANFWLAYNDREEEGILRIQVGDTSVTADFFHWRSGQPNGLREQNCLMATYSEYLVAQDKACTNTYRYVCEYRKAGDSPIDNSRLCDRKDGRRIRSDKALRKPGCGSVDTCSKLCEGIKTCLGFNFYPASQNCDLLADNVYTVGRRRVTPDATCVAGTHRSRKFRHCPQEADIRNPNSGICYQYVRVQRDWHTAQAKCVENGGNLAIIDKQATFDFLKANSEGFRNVYYIGLSDEDMEGQYYWQWGDEKIPAGIKFWRDDQPNDPSGSQNCVGGTAGSGQLWQDKPCAVARDYICQYAPHGYEPIANWVSGFESIANRQLPLTKCIEKTGISRKACARYCFLQKDCRSFDHGGTENRCRILKSSAYTDPESMVTSDVLTHFICKLRKFSHCPPGSVKMTRSDRCLKVFTEPADYETASRNCARGGYLGTLVMVDRSAVVYALGPLRKRFTMPFWNGCNRKNTRRYGWDVRGVQVNLGRFQKWRDGVVPSDGSKRCTVCRNDDLTWQAESCGNKRPYVCEYRPAGVTFTTGSLNAFQKFHGHRLDEKSLELTADATDLACAKSCIIEETCLSFNFDYESNKCELSRFSRFTKPSDVRKVQGYIHYVHRGRRIGHCPEGAIIVEGSRRCYSIGKKPLSWAKAQKDCGRRGGKLAVLPDEATWKSVQRQWPRRSPSECWMGMVSDARGKLKWSWGVRQFDIRKSFHKWEGGRLSRFKHLFRGRRDKVCGLCRGRRLRWKLAACGDRKPYICEYRAPGDEEVTATCPKGWGVFSGMCYMAEKNPVGYDDARGICNQYGGELVSIGSRDENDFIADYLKKKVGRDTTPVWIGLTDKQEEKHWIFLDGTDWENDYNNWADAGDPYREDRDDCGAIVPGGRWRLKWKDRSCNSKYYFMCKGRPENVKNNACHTGEVQCPTNAHCVSSVRGPTCACNHGYTATMTNGDLTGCSKSRICYGSGDPHFVTWDGLKIHFQGICRYTMAKPCDGAVGTNDLFNVTVKHEYRNNRDSVSWIKTVYVQAYGIEVALLKGKKLKVNGEERHPGIQLAAGRISIDLESCRTLTVTLVDMGVRVSFTDDSKARVEVPDHYFSKMCGICGNMNDDIEDDRFIAYTTTQGDYTEIGNSWQTFENEDDVAEALEAGRTEECNDMPQPPVIDECKQEDKFRYESSSFCGWLNGIRFQEGHGVMEVAGFIEDCVYDLCVGFDAQVTLCRYADSYADMVRQNGKQLTWREGSPCAPDCPANADFRSSVSACPATCRNPDAPGVCTLADREGCECRAGFILSGRRCVLNSECGCNDEMFNTYRQIGDVWTDGNCNKRYECKAGGVVDVVDIVCHERATCRKNIATGQKSCTCNRGFKGDGVATCNDINECDTDRRICGRDGVCQNTEGSYHCTTNCGPGFASRRGRCRDINECRDNNGGCTYRCKNRRGSYRCKCPAGKKLRDDGVSCTSVCGGDVKVVINPPTINPNPYERQRTGDWSGLADKLRKLDDEGEESSSASNSGDSSGSIEGLSECMCPGGALGYYVGGSSSLSESSSEVVDGLIKCVCPDGGTAIADGDAINKWERILNWHEDRRQLDRDWIQPGSGDEECTATGEASGGPLQIPGDGVQLNPETNQCEDVDECRAGTHRCPSGSRCRNTVGGYTCICRKGSLARRSDGGLECQGWGMCRFNGDPHYYSFDGQKIDFMGACTYTLAKPCPQNQVCTIPFFNVEVKNYRKEGRNPKVSWTKYMIIDIESARIQLGPGRGKIFIGDVPDKGDHSQFDGVELFAPVVNYPSLPGVEIKEDNCYMSVESAFLKVKYDGGSKGSVEIPAHVYRNIGMCGICGNYNGDKVDDLQDRYGNAIREISVERRGRTRKTYEFSKLGESWRVLNSDRIEGCATPEDIDGGCPTDSSQAEVNGMCSAITDTTGPFADCIGAIMGLANGQEILDQFVLDCRYDLCKDFGNKAAGLCNALATFNTACNQDYGLDSITWRTETFCPMSCGRNSVFQHKMTSCPLTCYNRNDDPCACSEGDREGCACITGHVLSGEHCVPVVECGCRHPDRGYMPVGESFISDDCSKSTICSANGLVTVSAQPCHVRASCRIKNGVRGCHCNRGLTGDGVNICEDENECTSGSHGCSVNAVCNDANPGYTCTCTNGYTGDGKTCSEVPTCPEHYKRGNTGRCEDINECRDLPDACAANALCQNYPGGYKCYCKNGMTGDPYLGGCKAACVCRAAGDPHYETCDGKGIDFQGLCKYTMAKTCQSDPNLPDFNIEAKNRRWKKSETSFVDYVDVNVCGRSIRLHQGLLTLVDGMQKTPPLSFDCGNNYHFEVNIVNKCRKYLAVLSSNFGLSVEWDGRWDVKILISESYSNKICGLCGNYDGNPDNDPTIQGGEIDPGVQSGEWMLYNDFGNSWKVADPSNPSCDDGEDDEPICTDARRKISQAACSVLMDSGGMFSECLAALGYRKARRLARNCMFDYCMTPDDAVLGAYCDSLEEYVQTCLAALGRNSLSFNWRSTFNCPSSCEDPNMVFKENAPGCAKTCEDPQGNRECDRPNGPACVCKDGFVVLGPRCVEESSCNDCRDMDNNIRAVFDRWVTNDCVQTCVCYSSGVQCSSGPTCPKVRQSCGQDRFGAWGCQCEQGFMMNDDGDCDNIDECRENGGHNCHANAICNDLAPGFDCTCKTGYSGNGFDCKLDDPNPVCLEGGQRYNVGDTVPGGLCQVCECRATLTDPRVRCADIDCASPSPYCLELGNDPNVCCQQCLKEGCIDMYGTYHVMFARFHPDICHTQICGANGLQAVPCESIPAGCQNIITPDGKCCPKCDDPPPPPPPTCAEMTCPAMMGWDLSQLPLVPDARLHVFRDKKFDCPGTVTQVEYFRSVASGVAYLGVLRPSADGKLTVVGRVTLESAPVGVVSVTLEMTGQISVERDDVLAVWYSSYDNNGGVISMADASNANSRCFGTEETDCISSGEFAYTNDDTGIFGLEVGDVLTLGSPKSRRMMPIRVHVVNDRMPITQEVSLSEERKKVDCSSRRRQYKECDLNGYVMNIKLKRQRSSRRSPCIEGLTYGLKGSKIWVDNGCRAQFIATYCRVSVNCADGYEYDTSVGECIDINECSQRGICPSRQPCLNTEGGYRCLAYCTISGDPHYYTFDGVKLNFQGRCIYNLVTPCPKEEQVSIPNFRVHAMNIGSDTKDVSWIKEAYITIGDYYIVIKTGPTVFINGVTSSPQFELPTDYGHTITGNLEGPYVTITTSFDLFISYAPDRRTIKILLPEDYKHIGMCGICGNYDGDQDNDYTTAAGEYVGDINGSERDTKIGDSWAIRDPNSNDECVTTPPPKCDEAVLNTLSHEANCGKITKVDGPFASCLAANPDLVEGKFEQCLYDGCLVPENPTGEMCIAMEALFDACELLGYTPTWDQQADCPDPCGANMDFLVNYEDCEPTCVNLYRSEMCIRNSKEGCFCQANFYRSGSDCVPQDQCGCVADDGTYMEINMVREYCDKSCQCASGNVITCTLVTNPCADGEVCYMNDGNRACRCDESNGYIMNNAGACVKTICPEGQVEFRGSCYEIPDDEKPFVTGLDYCFQKGGRMVIITDQELNDFVQQLIKDKRIGGNAIPKAFIGLNDQVTEGSFFWSNNQPLNNGDYVNWKQASGPSATLCGDDCVFMSQYSGLWSDKGCSADMPFVCEYGPFTSGILLPNNSEDLQKMRQIGWTIWCTPKA